MVSTARHIQMVPIAIICLIFFCASSVPQTTLTAKGAGRGGQATETQGGGQSSGKGSRVRTGWPSPKLNGNSRAATATNAVPRSAGEDTANGNQKAAGDNDTTVTFANDPTSRAAMDTKADSDAVRPKNRAVRLRGAVASNPGGSINRDSTGQSGSHGRSYRRNRSRGGHAYSYPPRGTPALSVDSSQPRLHVLSFGGKQHRGHGNALPHGVTSVEVWGKIGGSPPVNPSELVRGAVANGNSLSVSFDVKQADTIAYYAIRYVNSQGTGTFSKIISAPIRGRANAD